MDQQNPSSHRRGYLAFLTVLITVGATVLALPVLAVNATGAFELDGNASSSTLNPGAPDDWDRVCHQVLLGDCSTTFNTNGASAVEFASQPASGGTTFTGGGSKDPIDISSWAWNQGSGGLPGKDILLNGFAARYNLTANSSCPSAPCTVLFFGMDRFDNAGDAQNGFWFFQNPISLGTAKSGGGQAFAGVHKNGDLLVVSDFSIGGTISTVSVYIWNSACTAAGKPIAACADSNLQLLQSSTAANCATASATAAFCGIVNGSDGTAAPWPFTGKSGNTTFAQGEFYEGGINLSAFPGLASECFASTLAESRSSTSTSAVLKSFIRGNFGTCSSSVTTTASDANGNPISGPLSIGTGSVTVTDSATVTVGGAATWNGSVAFFLCGPGTTNGGNCATDGTAIPPSKAVSNSTPTVLSASATVTSVGSYCWRGYFTSATTGVPNATDDGMTNPNECFTVNPVTPTLTTQASGPILLGGTISDMAHLTGTANEPGTPVINGPVPPATSPAGGTITFAVFGPSNPCGGTPAFTSTNTAVSGDGFYGSGNFTPTAVGTYTFVASYGGDSPNTNPAPATACPDTTGTETVVVSDTSSATSAQTWVPNDSGTVSSGSGSTPLSGTLTIQMYTGADCVSGHEAGQVYTKTLTNATALADRTLTTGNSTAFSVDTTISWLVKFTPAAGSNVSGSSHCENSSVTITN